MDKIIHHSVRLQCNSNKAFELFTNNQMLESWLTRVAEVEPIIGGKYELFWEPDNIEENSTIGCRITAIKPNHFLSFEWRSPKQFKHFANQADPLTHVVVFFIPCEIGTEVHIVHSAWRNTAEWEEARKWQDQAWQMAFQSLKKYVNGESTKQIT